MVLLQTAFSDSEKRFTTIQTFFKVFQEFLMLVLAVTVFSQFLSSVLAALRAGELIVSIKICVKLGAVLQEHLTITLPQGGTMVILQLYRGA